MVTLSVKGSKSCWTQQGTAKSLDFSHNLRPTNFISLACSKPRHFPIGGSSNTLGRWKYFCFDCAHSHLDHFNFYDNVQLSLSSNVSSATFQDWYFNINFEDDNCILSRSVIFWGWCLVHCERWRRRVRQNFHPRQILKTFMARIFMKTGKNTIPAFPLKDKMNTKIVTNLKC